MRTKPDNVAPLAKDLILVAETWEDAALAGVQSERPAPRWLRISRVRADYETARSHLRPMWEGAKDTDNISVVITFPF